MYTHRVHVCATHRRIAVRAPPLKTLKCPPLSLLPSDTLYFSMLQEYHCFKKHILNGYFDKGKLSSILVANIDIIYWSVHPLVGDWERGMMESGGGFIIASYNLHFIRVQNDML